MRHLVFWQLAGIQAELGFARYYLLHLQFGFLLGVAQDMAMVAMDMDVTDHVVRAALPIITEH